VCNAVSVNGAPVLDPTKHLACYKIKSNPGQPGHSRQDITYATEFGGAAGTTVKPTLVCVPARVEGP